MLDAPDGDGIGEKELHWCGELVDIAKDLVEYDVMCAKLKKMGMPTSEVDIDDYEDDDRDTMNPNKR